MFDLIYIIYADSFGQVWFWIVYIILWMRFSFYVLSVPVYLVHLSVKQGALYAQECEDLLILNATRFIRVWQKYNWIMIGCGAFVFSITACLGFFFHMEFMQAITLIFLFFCLGLLWSVRLSLQVIGQGLRGEALFHAILKHKVKKDFVGVVVFILMVVYAIYVLLLKGRL